MDTGHPGPRDYLYKSLNKKRPRIFKDVDLRENCPPVESQGNLGSCTANALAGGLEYLEKIDRARYENLSRLFIYYNERVLERTVNSDPGAQIRTGVKTLAKQGVCSEKIWPYNIPRFKIKPSRACYARAKKHQITSYHRILTLDDMRICLSEGYPFVFGITLHDSFRSKKVYKTGVVDMPKRGDHVIGGHAVLAVGFNERTKRFLARNSWGGRWGKKGYFTIPYDYLCNSNLADDFWTIRRANKL